MFVVFAEHSISDDLLAEMNRKFKNRAVFASSARTDTHMFDGKLMLKFYGDVIGPALRVQRRRHNLTHQHRGMILFDKCPAHLDRRFAKAREQFSESLNVELFGDTGIETPTPDVLPFTLGHITNAIWKQATK